MLANWYVRTIIHLLHLVPYPGEHEPAHAQRKTADLRGVRFDFMAVEVAWILEDLLTQASDQVGGKIL